MEYDWYKIYVMQKYEELKKLQPKNDTKEIRYAIATSEDLLNYRESRKKKPTTSEIFFRDYEKLKRSQMLWPDLSAFAKSAKENINFNTDILKMCLSNEELLCLTHDFFKNATPKEIFKQFMHFYKQKNKNVHIFRNTSVDFYADSFYLPYYRDLFIQLKPRNEFEDASTLAHEYGHGIHFYNNFHPNIYYKNYIFIEIISTFFEYLMLIYYSHTGSYQEVAINCFIDTYEERKAMAENIQTFFNYAEYIGLKENLSKKEEINLITSFCNYYGDEQIKDLFNEGSIAEDAIYVFATSIVCELLCIYYEDPDKTFYLVKRLMKIDPRLSPERFYEEILKLGITPNENIATLNNHLKRELTRFS